MHRKPRRWAQSRSRHDRPDHARAPCTPAVEVNPVCHHIRTLGNGIGLFPRLAFASNRFPQPDPWLASRSVHKCSRAGVDCRRVSPRPTRSSVAYDPHDEAPSIDDSRCSASSGGCAGVSFGVRVTEGFHHKAFPFHSACSMARTLADESRVVLAGRLGGCNRMASSRRISVGDAFPLGAQPGGRIFSAGWLVVLVAHRAVTRCDEVTAVVHGFVSLPCHVTL